MRTNTKGRNGTKTRVEVPLACGGGTAPGKKSGWERGIVVRQKVTFGKRWKLGKCKGVVKLIDDSENRRKFVTITVVCKTFACGKQVLA
jgi:hypothetical protein